MNTIRSRLLTSMILTGLVPLIFVLVPLATVISYNLRVKEEENLVERANQLGRLVAEVTDRTTRELGSLQSNPLLSDPEGDLETKLTEMHRLVHIFEVYSDISLYDGEGFLLGSTAEDHPAFRDYSDWFREAKKGKSVLSQPRRVLGKEGLYLTVYLPVRGPRSEHVEGAKQIIKARLSFARIVSILNDEHISGGGRVFLLDSLGNTLSGGGSAQLLEKFDPAVPATNWLTNLIGIYAAPNGEKYLYASKVLPSTVTRVDSHWIVLTLKPMEKVTEVVSQASITLIAAILLMMLVAATLGAYLSKRISHPLECIGEVARKVAAGDLEVRAAEEAGSIETRDLATLFNQMVAELADHRHGLETLVASRTESLHRSQSELERAGTRLQAAIESTDNGFLVEDLNGNVEVVNDLFLTLLGFDHESFHPEKAEEILSAFTGLGPERLSGETEEDWKRRRANGEVIDSEVVLSLPERRVLRVYSAPVKDIRDKIVGRVWNTHDLTAQRELEEGLRQSQKMEAVGQLAGGVAHDFNNLLAAILGNLGLVQMDLGATAGKDARESLSHAIKAGERAAELVRQLLGFSRRSHLDLKPCDANLVLAEVRDILTATIDPRITLKLELEPSPWRAIADVGMLGQVIMNMGVNAKDAMPNGGRLILRSSNRTLNSGDLRNHPEIPAGDFICLSVEDQGEGMPLAVQAKIFEPFFTTKEPGKGTGLGLATSFGIVKQLGGWIDFRSQTGEGTCFDIYLPRNLAAEAGNSPALLLAPKEPHLAHSRRGETILLVDDEFLVRRIGRTLLSKLGYEIIEAQDGLEALEICRTRGESISLVLLDLTMPNLTGKETFARIREALPDLPVLICSGYLVDLNEFTRECGSCPDGFVQKPYSFEDMADIVRRTLDSQSHAA
jgi:signal transduction histidine kinase/CheY-like chemotaxis protein/HAMP domain-containing protein